MQNGVVNNKTIFSEMYDQYMLKSAFYIQTSVEYCELLCFPL